MTKKVKMTEKSFHKFVNKISRKLSSAEDIFEFRQCIEEISKNAKYFPKGCYFVIGKHQEISSKNIPVGITPHGEIIFKDSLIEARDINPIGAFNYASLICKHDGKYGFWMDDYFCPARFNNFDAIMFKVRRFHATVKDYEKWKEQDRDYRDEQIDRMIFSDRCLKND